MVKGLIIFPNSSSRTNCQLYNPQESYNSLSKSERILQSNDTHTGRQNVTQMTNEFLLKSKVFNFDVQCKLTFNC